MLGSAAGLCAREPLRRGSSPWRSPYPVGVLANVLFVMSPLSLILALAYPEWAAAGLGGAEALSLGIWLAVLGGSALLALCAFWLQVLLKHQAPSLAATPLLLTLAGFVGVSIAFSEELALNVQGEESAGPLLVTLVFSLPVMLAGWAFLLTLYGLEGRKMRLLVSQAQHTPAQAIGQADTRAKL